MGTPLRTALAAVVAALALVLTGCTGDPEAADDTADTGQQEQTEEPAEDGPVAGEEVDKADFVANMREGLENATTAQVTMTVDAAGQALEAEGQLDYTTEPTAMQMTMSMPTMSQQPIEFRLVDGVMYMNMGQMSLNKFMSFDLNDAKNLPPGMDGFTEQLDPLGGFEQFEESITSVTYVGEEDVDGEQLDRYALTVDTKTADGFQGLPSGQGVPEEVTFDFWVDDDFLARRMSTSLDAGPQSVSMDIRMTGWGEPVTIEAPPAKEIIDPRQLQGQR
ncbi:DUF7537 family lipoprotein [Nocardioides coralli]|uniref:DUF7537 family lipoprotein n=1 Tax=Nocardioides coralli TaxID=2872154 RepID=UPI001CA3D16A|nr:LppX_LprAFG lipoprotein [Nocardioides coralli]QZY30374.1 LppX_LprAFG lipoprotein [Nocardioides coralli]